MRKIKIHTFALPQRTCVWDIVFTSTNADEPTVMRQATNNQQTAETGSYMASKTAEGTEGDTKAILRSWKPQTTCFEAARCGQSSSKLTMGTGDCTTETGSSTLVRNRATPEQETSSSDARTTTDNHGATHRGRANGGGDRRRTACPAAR